MVKQPAAPLPQVDTQSDSESTNAETSTAKAVSAPSVAPESGQPSTAVGALQPSGKKWVQDQRGVRYMVSKDSALPPGWKEIPPPANPPLAGVPPIQTYSTTPQTYTPQLPPTATSVSNAPPPVQTYVQSPQQPVYSAPMQLPPSYSPPQASSGLPPGKKKLRHQSGYIVIVDQNTTPGPEFTEVEQTVPSAPQGQPTTTYQFAPPLQQPYAAVPQTYGQPQVQPYTQPAPAPAYQPGQATAQPPTVYQAPQTYSAPPQLPYLPPTWQQQLPYQPPQPQYQTPPMPVQPYGVQQPPGPVPVIRTAPPGKKWVADQSGIRYLVNEDTIVLEGSGMREVTEEELNRPMVMMPQQQQQRGSFLGRLFGGGR